MTNESLAELRDELTQVRSEAKAMLNQYGSTDSARWPESAVDELESLQTRAVELQDEISAHAAKLEKTPEPSMQRRGRKTTQHGPAKPGSATARTAEAGSSKYAQMFGNQEQTSGQFASRGEFLQTLARNPSDSRLAHLDMTEGVGSSGGYLVPAEYRSGWLDSVIENSIVMPRATIYPMTTNSLSVASFDGSDRSSNIYGITAYWTAEAATITESTPEVRNVNFSPHKLAAIVDCSSELLADGMQVDSYVSRGMSESLAFELDYQCIWGTGAGMPLGLMNAPSLVTAAKVGSQTASTIVPANIMDMAARLHPSCDANAVWLAHPSCKPQLYKLSTPGQDAVGAASTVFGHSLFVSTGGDAPAQRLLGYPLIFTEKASQLGTAGDLILCDWSKYGVGLRKEISVDRSLHSGWTTDMVSFRCIMRADAQPLWAEAQTPKKGSDSMSWAVALATRS